MLRIQGSHNSGLKSKAEPYSLRFSPWLSTGAEILLVSILRHYYTLTLEFSEGLVGVDVVFLIVPVMVVDVPVAVVVDAAIQALQRSGQVTTKVPRSQRFLK